MGVGGEQGQTDLSVKKKKRMKRDKKGEEEEKEQRIRRRGKEKRLGRKSVEV